MSNRRECPFCLKEFKTTQSRGSHQSLCKMNPNRRDLSGKNNPQEDDQSPLPTPPMIIDEEEMERQAKLLSIATSLSSPIDLENPNSPQSKALEWLLGPANALLCGELDRKSTRLNPVTNISRMPSSA